MNSRPARLRSVSAHLLAVFGICVFVWASATASAQMFAQSAATSSPQMTRVIDFEGFGADTVFGDDNTSNGYGNATLSYGATAFSSGDYFQIGNAVPSEPTNGTGILVENRDYTFHLSTQGVVFDLVSLDLGEDLSSGNSAQTVRVQGDLATGGETQAIITLSGDPNTLQTYQFTGFNHLAGLTITGMGASGNSIYANGFTLDNIVMAVTVPEPSCWALFIVGSVVCVVGKAFGVLLRRA